MTLAAMESIGGGVVGGGFGLDRAAGGGQGQVLVAQAVQGQELDQARVEARVEEVQAAVGGDAEQNAQIMRALFAGKAIPSRNAFVLNAAAALVVSDSMTPTAATQRVVQCLDSGDAAGKLESWRSAATKRSSSTSS